MLREYLISEAMHALGHPDHARARRRRDRRAGPARDGCCPARCSCRVAASHLRVGTFQYAAATGDAELLRAPRRLRDRPPPPRRRPGGEPVPRAATRRVVDAQAALIARWMLVGFIHGVMNTDNMTISGETIDYGPCAFMDAFDPATVFSSIDHGGRYAYGNQPRDRAVEPRAAGRGAAAADRRGHRRGGRGRDGGARTRSPTASERHWDDGHAREARPATGDRRPGAGRGPAGAAAGPARRLHLVLPRAVRGAARRPFLDRDAFDAWAARWRAAAAERRTGRRWRRRWTASTPSTSRATTRRGGAHRGDRGRPGALPAAARRVSRPFDERPGLEEYAGPRPTTPRTSPTAAPDVSPAPGA